MNRLPDEILLVIFDLIDDLRTKVGLERVCRRWRNIMLRFEWKLVRHIELENVRWIEPLGHRCGAHLIACCFSGVAIDCKMIRLIADHFPAIKHLDFRHCKFIGLDASVLESIQKIGIHIRSLNFFAMYYRSELDYLFLRNFPGLRHLGLSLYSKPNDDVISLPSNFSAQLRSLYLSSSSISISDLEQILAMVQKDCPKLAALYVDVSDYYACNSQPFLSRISDLKSLRFFRLAADCYFICPKLLRSCLNSLPQLHAIQLSIYNWYLPDVLPCLHGLMHLSISFSFDLERFDSYELVGLQSIVAPQLRSLSLDALSIFGDDELPYEMTEEIAYGVLKIANNSNLEYINTPNGLFSVGMLCQLIQLCPNLHSFGAKLFYRDLWDMESNIDKLWRVVAEQWRTGTRKHLPLRIWLYGVGGSDNDSENDSCPTISWQDPFLAIQTVQHGFTPPNQVLNALFRDEIFNDNDSGGTPSFVTEYYSQKT